MNLQPILNLIGNTGELTSEYKAFKSASTFGKATMVVSLLIAAAGFIASSLPGSKAATIAGLIGAGAGLIGTFLASIHYQSGRQNLKANAVSILKALAATETGAAALLAPVPIIGLIPPAASAVAKA